MSRFNDLTGKRFGNWLVLERAEDYVSPKGRKTTQYLCECQCSNKTRKLIIGQNLIRGKTISCGCMKNELIAKSKIKHNKYDLSGEYGKGYTEKGEEFWFDKEDYNLISNYSWHTDKSGYYVAGIKKDDGRWSTIKLHRLVMGVKDPKQQVDHIGHNLSDNRKVFLRVVTCQENTINKRRLDSNTSGVTGVYFDRKRSKWISQIRYDEKVYVIGAYNNFNDAVKARKEAEEKYFGEYSYDNSMNIYKEDTC